MARAGTIQALDSDYTRTATKGLSHSEVVRGHVLRNALLPTISVISTQVGYLIDGLVVIETLFNYQGIGLLILNAAQAKDFPCLLAASWLSASSPRGDTIADLHDAFLNPASASPPVSTVENPLVLPPGTLDDRPPHRSAGSSASSPPHADLPRRACDSRLWVACAVIGERLTPHNPYETGEGVLTRPDASNWFGTATGSGATFLRASSPAPATFSSWRHSPRCSARFSARSSASSSATTAG